MQPGVGNIILGLAAAQHPANNYASTHTTDSAEILLIRQFVGRNTFKLEL